MDDVRSIIEYDECKRMLKVKQATGIGYEYCVPGGCFDGSYTKSKTRRGRVQGGGRISPTITCNSQIFVFELKDKEAEKWTEKQATK